jgi:hypothetical protein
MFSAQGSGALLTLINRVNTVYEFYVDDKPWEAKLDLVAEMNTTVVNLGI